ncbi:unnamed protein product [Rotaria sp. Silwood1]|nr:unnamed protein product [Rotaria sp. Silwood1]CAF4650499.1 unnamed protein product [Rotaria sp. Silwood1]CAF4722319.1 unnamed protein product [Rotaria sp. Silwood1]
MKKSDHPKFHQCLPTNDQNSIELIPDGDSGTEEIEQQQQQQQQLEYVFRATPNDNEDQLSIKSFTLISDEGFSECETQDETTLTLIKKDLKLAQNIPDHTKKDFCSDTSIAFHGEFARRISVPLSLCHKSRYYLFTEEELADECYANLQFDYFKLDNAKAQFQCSNIYCQHSWTSMRARVSFSVCSPKIGFIVLKIFGQNCQHCNSYTQALWYIDEVCRVMKNLALSIFERYFPDMINNIELENQKLVQNNSKRSRASHHDPAQRKGKMMASHAREHCEACRRGVCFI